MANINIKRYNGDTWEIHYPKTTIGQVINLSSQLANIQSDVDGLTENGKIKSSLLPGTFQNLTDGSSNLPYRFDLIVYGDSDKYYPVHFAKGNQNLLRTIKIWRAYSEQAPGDWHTSTHKGSLNLVWQGNYGSWGGAVYTQWIYENSSQYTTLLAGTQLVDNSYGIAFFLRGGGVGGAIYHIASDQPLNWSDPYLTYTVPTAFYNQEKTFTYSNPANERYAPAFKTSVDTNQLNSITVVKGGDPRLTNARTPTAHSHTIAQVTGLQTALDGKAASSHSHTITNITGLQTALDGKAASSHQHSATDIIGGRFSLDRLPTGLVGTVLKGNDLLSPVWGSISWGEVQSKPTWIGASKPTYTASDVGALADTHPAKDVTALDMGRWSNAFNWGNHATQGYLKEASLVGGVSTIVSSNLTTNRALISNGSGKVAVSAVTSTELGRISGITGNIMTLLGGKAASSHGHTWTEITNKPALLRQVSFTGGTLIVEMM